MQKTQRKYRRLKLYIIVISTVGIGLLSVTGVWAMLIHPWFWADNVVNIAGFPDVRASVSIAVKENDIAVAYAGDEDASGIYLRMYSDDIWSNNLITSTATNHARRYPSMVILGGDPLVAWTQSELSLPYDSQVQNLFQQDGLFPGHVTNKIAGPIYGHIVPDLVESSTGLHIIYPASTDQSSWSRPDLYYAHRYFTETTWSAPTRVLTHSQLIPGTMGGKIWYPKLAVSPDGQMLHVVWEQHIKYDIQSEVMTVWYMSGQWQPHGVIWNTGSAQRLSPVSQDYAVRPYIGVASSGTIHITWTELIPGASGTTNPEAQYINYMQLGNPGITKVNGSAIKVNSNSPTWASSAFALFEQDICVTWHGFYEGDSLEEITMRCSRDEGTTWQPLVNVSESPEDLSDFPAMAFDQDGFLHVVWEERELQGTSYQPKGIYYRGGQPHHYQIYFPVVFRQG